MDADEAIKLIAENIGLGPEDSDPQTVVQYVGKLCATRTMMIKTVERRKKALADALEMDEGVPFPRLIEQVTDYVKAEK
jgi:hypothetical protein